MVTITVTFSTQSVSANPINNQGNYLKEEAPQSSQVTDLTTEAATINNRWDNSSETTNSLNDSVSSISIIREEDCRKIDPNEILKNPGSFFRQCPVVEKNQTPELGEKIQYFQVPKLDSGIKLDVTRF
ncbi:hypothetical protein [Calothrix sp. UHCC 0171]|uniref:hypothetical protein n=1 Tax=Calothrix sp. UHCC 0171 TaxID=3110245 RepID=UPI002B21E461|nr:hypothetical protein [Calothrix sp. UHCC 0171]MEA5570166.1 hypothetical protein [Calothrix sp. UHCC 0171]